MIATTKWSLRPVSLSEGQAKQSWSARKIQKETFTVLRDDTLLDSSFIHKISQEFSLTFILKDTIAFGAIVLTWMAFHVKRCYCIWKKIKESFGRDLLEMSTYVKEHPTYIVIIILSPRHSDCAVSPQRLYLLYPQFDYLRGREGMMHWAVSNLHLRCDSTSRKKLSWCYNEIVLSKSHPIFPDPTAQCSRCQLGCSGSQNFPCISGICYRSILSENIAKGTTDPRVEFWLQM